MTNLIRYLKINFIVVICILLSVLNIFFLNTNVARVIFLDVGQGDAALIQFGDFDILIDGGPGPHLESKLKSYMNFDNHKIELVILTHPHLDHMGGLFNVIDKYFVPTIWINEVCYESEYYRSFLEKYRNLIVQVVMGTSASIENVFRLSVLYPFESEVIDKSCPKGYGKYESFDRNVNNDSIVVRLEASQKTFLFMGDAEIGLERRLLNAEVLYNVDILKAGHHCSKTSSSQRFLDTVNPQIAICSCGENNKYGHPSKDVLGRMKEMKINYFVTYESSDVVIQL